MIRAMYSPSKLALVITRNPMPRKTYADGMMQECQKEATRGRCCTVCCAPSSNEMETRSVEPIARMSQYPSQLMAPSARRWVRLNRRGAEPEAELESAEDCSVASASRVRVSL